MTVADPYRFEQRWRAIGAIGNRIVTLVHTAEEGDGGQTDHRGRIILARKATQAERRRYEEGTF